MILKLKILIGCKTVLSRAREIHFGFFLLYCVGGETKVQTWPIQTVPRAEHPFVTGDFLQDFQFGGLLETYWLASSGVAVHVDEQTPLFTSKIQKKLLLLKLP